MDGAGSINTNDSDQDPEQVYADLVRLYPKNAGFLRRYAEILHQTEKETTATEVLRQLHHVLTEQGEKAAAEKLSREHPQIGNISANDGGPNDGSPFLGMVGKGMFSALSAHQRLSEGRYLFHMGEHCKAYLILDGELALMLPGKDGGKPVLLNLLHRGDVVGISDFLEGNSHPVDAIANRNTTVFELSRKQLLKFFLQHTKVEKQMQLEEEERHRTWMISSHPLLSNCPLAIRKHLASGAGVRSYEAGEMIIKAGQPIPDLMLIVSGKAYTQVVDKHGVNHVLEQLNANQLLGTLATLRKSTAVVDVLAQIDVTVLLMPLSSVTTAMQAHPPLKEVFLRLSENSMSKTMQAIENLSLRKD
ncbi:MAG: cyclic nucleotide-binding domain-containing protein [Mariprofundaceae bacterium]